MVQSMEWVKLTFKNLTWKVKLEWNNGKFYLDRKWYKIARCAKLRVGDTLVFAMTGDQQKYEMCVYEKGLLSRCNTCGKTIVIA